MMNELCDVAAKAYAALLALTPTTVAGATAVLLYVTKHENRWAPWTENWGDTVRSGGTRFPSARRSGP